MALYHTTVLDNQIKALPTVDTASGSIATFDTDMTENLIEVKCQIVAQQASGTPSPSNPRPITVYSEANVVRCGKNLIPDEYVVQAGVNNIYIAYDEGLLLEAGSYTLSVETASNLYIIKYSDNSAISTIYNNTKNTFTLSEKTKIKININRGGVLVTDNIQLEKGNTATTIEQRGNAYNIPFGQTVANGVLDVTTGKLRVTHGVYVITGNETFTTTEAGQKAIINPSLTTLNAKNFDNSENANVDCEIAESKPYATINVSGTTTGIGIGLYYIIIGSEQYNAWNDCVGKKLVYELTTPIEIQLDSTQITALLNENNIWCDTNGDTEVKYLLTVGKKIS